MRNLEVATFLRDRGAARPPGLLHYSIKIGSPPEVVQWLLDTGYHVNEQDEVSELVPPMFLQYSCLSECVL